MQEKNAEPRAHCTARQSSFGTSFNVIPNNFYQAAIRSTSESAHLLAVLFSLLKHRLQSLLSLAWLKGPVIHCILGSVTVLADPTVSRL